MITIHNKLVKDKSTIMDTIRELFFSLHGAFVPKYKEVPEELKDIYHKIYDDIEMETPSSDKINMREDVKRFRHDFKKAIESYKEEKEEVVNG